MSDWHLVYRAANDLEAELLKGMLAQSGITVQSADRHLAGGLGELPMDAGQVRLYVQLSDWQTARDLLDAYEGREQVARPTTADWYCPQCGEANQQHFEICWRCQARPLTDSGLEK
ncbi:DUF2007 domain-containing protein [Idiomarina xiamenensis]|uniref:RanBP2-type domain-containing protein n=1 Tax=Idiomarina xiamenensis 10-D-4 TaxID=740709 RepID=K2K143_9GAMM|nr:DUF2007 domain-containing protein [Idiomarina xiamenensis]EKE81458.1 hypothetical protein A10D4_10286 [Idiomarina xiamenensis 10-D-4]